MSIKLSQIVPWGRSFDEYCRMFNLESQDLNRPIVGCGDGPASFNAEMRTRGRRVTSLDPVYCFAGDEIARRFMASVDGVLSQVAQNAGNYVWGYHSSIDQLRANRVAVMEAFLADYGTGLEEGRYIYGELPQTEFQDGEFEIALCSHLLFLYSELLSYEFHLLSILEMCRIAREARVFPLLGLDCKESPYLRPIVAKLQWLGYHVEVEKVGYELQRGANRMLRVKRPEAWRGTLLSRTL